MQWQYDKTGDQQIWYKPTYPAGVYGKTCPDSAQKNLYVSDVLARFSIDASRSGPLDIYFKNESQNGVRFLWDYGHPASGSKNQSIERDGYHVYHPNKGSFEVCLIAFNSQDCPDTFCLPIDLDYSFSLFIPNVFTPEGGDGFNEAFDILIEGEEDYDLKIYNRHSQLVYQSAQDGVGKDGINWDGRNPEGIPLPPGVYYVVFDYKFFYRQEQRYTGTLTLIR